MKKKWPDIWIEISKAYYVSPSKRTSRQSFIALFGLCKAIGRATDGEILDSVSVIEALNPDGCIFWWDYNRRSDLKRAEFAEHMAGLSHEDFEDFIKEGSQ